MTGYSNKTLNFQNISILIQIKSENSKNIDIYLIDESNNLSLGEDIRRKIEAALNRGKIKVILEIEFIDSYKHIEKIKNQINKYLKIIDSDKINMNISYSEINELLNIEKIKILKRKDIRGKIIGLLNECIVDLIQKQTDEGKVIIRSVNSKITKIESIKNNFRRKFRLYSKKLEKKYIKEISQIGEFSNQKKDISPMIEKIDIEEEIVRLESHLNAIKKIIKKNKGNIGLTLDFYMQEINREANTLSSKSKDPKLSEDSIKIKSLVNQIRELSANLA
tara:strand:- start:46233 stop:47066 length:834 start_codon:yes stop_codon:yes gene_type:complete